VFIRPRPPIRPVAAVTAESPAAGSSRRRGQPGFFSLLHRCENGLTSERVEAHLRPLSKKAAAAADIIWRLLLALGRRHGRRPWRPLSDHVPTPIASAGAFREPGAVRLRPARAAFRPPAGLAPKKLLGALNLSPSRRDKIGVWPPTMPPRSPRRSLPSPGEQPGLFLNTARARPCPAPSEWPGAVRRVPTHAAIRPAAIPGRPALRGAISPRQGMPSATLGHAPKATPPHAPSMGLLSYC